MFLGRWQASFRIDFLLLVLVSGDHIAIFEEEKAGERTRAWSSEADLTPLLKLDQRLSPVGAVKLAK
jgi:hypothetical protein